MGFQSHFSLEKSISITFLNETCFLHLPWLFLGCLVFNTEEQGPIPDLQWISININIERHPSLKKKGVAQIFTFQLKLRTTKNTKRSINYYPFLIFFKLSHNGLRKSSMLKQTNKHMYQITVISMEWGSGK